MTRDDVIALLRKRCEAAGTQRAFADRHGISPQFVANVLLGRRNPSGPLLDALGLRKVVTYERTEAGRHPDPLRREMESVTDQTGAWPDWRRREVGLPVKGETR